MRRPCRGGAKWPQHERLAGRAGNTALAAAFALARELDEDRLVVVQETEYTGAGKHPLAQLALAKRLECVLRAAIRAQAGRASRS